MSIEDCKKAADVIRNGGTLSGLSGVLWQRRCCADHAANQNHLALMPADKASIGGFDVRFGLRRAVGVHFAVLLIALRSF
jgi:hypothetical protein